MTAPLPLRFPEPDPSPADRARAAARADNTRRTYAHAWNRWRRWAAAAGRPVLPARPGDVADYIAERAYTHHRAYATIRVDLHAIAHYHAEAGHDNPIADPDVQRVRDGIANTIHRAQAQAAPLTEAVLQLIVPHLATPRRRFAGGWETPEQAAARAAVDLALLTVMRDGLLRAAEAAAARWRDLDDDLLGIPRSKTDQQGEGATVLLGPDARAALAAIRPAPCPPDARLFGGLSARAIARRIRAAARHAGILNWRRFSGHSPRVGMAQDLHGAGLDDTSIALAGRWADVRTVKGYLRGIRARNGAVARYYAGASAGDRLRPLMDQLREEH